MSERVSNRVLHSCYDWALMLCGGVFNHDWLSFCFLTCCCFDVECCRFSLFKSPSFFLSLLQFPHSLRGSFLKAITPQLNLLRSWFAQLFEKVNFLFLFVPQDAGSQQIGFLLGSCGVTLALTTDACQKGLPKAQTGEVATFKGTPRSIFILAVCLYWCICFELISSLCLCRLATVTVVCDRWKTCC